VSQGYLLVHAEGRPYGLPLKRVLQVDDAGEMLHVPHLLAAMRGLTPWRGRLVPLVHLGALLAGRAAPEARGQTVVVVDAGRGERFVALEVDDADEVIRDPTLPLESKDTLPWASGVARRVREGTTGPLVPILDFSELEDRLG
jgi:chemotaxis signal transduction protein